MMDGISLPKSSVSSYYHPYAEPQIVISHQGSQTSSTSDSGSLPQLNPEENAIIRYTDHSLETRNVRSFHATSSSSTSQKSFTHDMYKKNNNNNKFPAATATGGAIQITKSSSNPHSFFPPIRLGRRHFSNFHYLKPFFSNFRSSSGSFHYHLPYSRKSYSTIDSRSTQHGSGSATKSLFVRSRKRERNPKGFKDKREIHLQVNKPVENNEFYIKVPLQQNGAGNSKPELLPYPISQPFSNNRKVFYPYNGVEHSRQTNSTHSTGGSAADLSHTPIRTRRSITSQIGFQPLGNEDRDAFKYFEHDLQSSFETEDDHSMLPSPYESGGGKTKSNLKNRSTKEEHDSLYQRNLLDEEIQEAKVSSVLEIGPLTRSDHGKIFSCWADNSKLTTSKTRNVKISMTREFDPGMFFLRT